MKHSAKNAFRLFTLVHCLLFGTVVRVMSQTCGPGISFESQAQVNNFPILYPGCTQIIGACSITGGNITDLSPLSQITSFGGHLNIINLSNLTSLNGLHNVTAIGGDLTIDNTPALSSLNGLNSLASIGGFLKITNTGLNNLSGLNNLTVIGSHLEIYSNSMLSSLSGLNSLTSTGGQLFISNNQVLANVDGLFNLGAIAGPLRINNNPVLTNLSGLSNLTSLGGGTIVLLTNPALNSLNGLDNIDYTTIGSWAGTYLSIVANSSLSICSVQSLCDYLENGGLDSGISSNASGCNTRAEVETACLALPVELSRFSAKREKDAVVMNWETLTETNHNYFQVEHSSEGVDFTVIGKIEAAYPQSAVLKAYQFVHKQPSAGTNYYRLKQVDTDGKYEYSHVVSVDMPNQSLQVTISPNPNDGRFTLNIQNPPSFPMTARLLDACGRAVWEANLEEGTEGASVDGQWPAGLYTLLLFGRQEVWARKVVVR